MDEQTTEQTAVNPVQQEYQTQLRRLANDEAQLALNIFQAEDTIRTLEKQIAAHSAAAAADRDALLRVRGAIQQAQARLRELPQPAE